MEAKRDYETNNTFKHDNLQSIQTF